MAIHQVICKQITVSQWRARHGNIATPWTNTKDSCWNKIRSCQDDAFWYLTRSNERSCWELEQNKNKFLFWPLRPRIFRITCRYLLHSLIFLHSLRIFKDFGMQIMIVYILPSELPNGILFIKRDFQIKITKCRTCTLAYLWWHRWCPGMFWNILVTCNATFLFFW